MYIWRHAITKIAKSLIKLRLLSNLEVDVTSANLILHINITAISFVDHNYYLIHLFIYVIHTECFNKKKHLLLFPLITPRKIIKFAQTFH